MQSKKSQRFFSFSFLFFLFVPFFPQNVPTPLKCAMKTMSLSGSTVPDICVILHSDVKIGIFARSTRQMLGLRGEKREKQKLFSEASRRSERLACCGHHVVPGAFTG